MNNEEFEFDDYDELFEEMDQWGHMKGITELDSIDKDLIREGGQYTRDLETFRENREDWKEIAKKYIIKNTPGGEDMTEEDLEYMSNFSANILEAILKTVENMDPPSFDVDTEEWK